ncbi:hypothetical protein BJV82DRAFT_615031 [Fennellomyces sp. T-0311]|nr:hypothetical protein BJV82DRAFT_615031 [Fennellomyces sp. T-0311]
MRHNQHDNADQPLLKKAKTVTFFSSTIWNTTTAVTAANTCLAAEPTMVEGSTYILPSASFTGDLTDVNLSDLLVGTPSSVIPAASSSAAISTEASSVTASATEPPVQTPTSSAKNTAEDEPLLSTGAIIGIAVGGFVFIVVLILLVVCMRRRRTEKFDRGRGITPSMVISTRSKTPSIFGMGGGGNQEFHHKPVQMYYPDKVMTQPSESITAALDQMYNVKQYNTKPQLLQPEANSSNPRLSKYNYLAQAFTQMRESYGPAPAAMTDTVRLRDDDDDNDSRNHVPTGLTPPPPRIAVFNEHSEQVMEDEPGQKSPKSRDSITSDVSQYSTFSNPFRYPSHDNVTPRPPPAHRFAQRRQYDFI